MTTVLAIMAFGLVASAQKRIKGNGNITTQSRSESGFDGVGATAGIMVEVSTGSGFAIELSGDENLMPYIETKVKNGNLVVGVKDGYSINPTKTFVARVKLPVIAAASVAGSGDVVSSGVLNTASNLKVSVAGSGSCKLHISNSSAVKASIAGSGNIRMRGATSGLEVSIAGSGNFEGYELQADNASISISGSGGVQTKVDKALKASISGSGDVTYKGSPATTFKSSGSGSLRKVD